MAMHLFSTPVQCTHCGTSVDDPTVDHCPQCGELLQERRTPGRIAGVERRYGNLRFMLALLRFVAVATGLFGVLIFLFGPEGDATPWTVRLLILAGTLVLVPVLFVAAGLIEVMLDMEENTRSAFRVQQQILEDRHAGHAPPA